MEESLEQKTYGALNYNIWDRSRSVPVPLPSGGTTRRWRRPLLEPLLEQLLQCTPIIRLLYLLRLRLLRRSRATRCRRARRFVIFVMRRGDKSLHTLREQITDLSE